MINTLRPALVLFTALTLLCGVVYPLVVTAVAQVVFPHAANGSLVVDGDHVVGSELIGQGFDDPKYFWSRPSATSTPYDATASAGSNLGPNNPALTEAVGARIGALHGTVGHPVPVDLVTASGSGLDPHISPAAAYYQVDRIAAARGVDPAVVRAVVDDHLEGRTFGFLGEPRVNVLAVNRALDAMSPPA